MYAIQKTTFGKLRKGMLFYHQLIDVRSDTILLRRKISRKRIRFAFNNYRYEFGKYAGKLIGSTETWSVNDVVYIRVNKKGRRGV